MPKLFKNCCFEQFQQNLINEAIVQITQKGKYLIFHLTNKKVFVVHLRMEGKLFFVNKNQMFDKKHTLVGIEMGHKVLLYHDTRRFGTFNLYNVDNYLTSAELKKIALDPLHPDFDSFYLQKKLQNSHQAIKTALLNQTKVAGIGNIYADEILYASKIHPQTKCCVLTYYDFVHITQNAKRIFQKAIKHKGTTIRSYLYRLEHFGHFQRFLQVHTKKNQLCQLCNATIIKIKVNNRGTYLCPNCQRIKNLPS